VGYEGYYWVSRDARIWGVKRKSLLKAFFDKDGYLKVTLTVGGVPNYCRMHRVVCEAFNGPAPEGKLLVLHGDKGVGDNTPSNLRWGNPRDNMQDRFRDGTDGRTITKECRNGHPYTKENTYWSPKKGSRSCRVCRGESTQRSLLRRGVSK